MSHFACNILELRAAGGKHVVAMSAAAHACFTVSALASSSNVLHTFSIPSPPPSLNHFPLSPLLPQPSQLSSLFVDAASSSPVVAPIPTIERVGGGSVRCMLCELF